MRIRNRSRRELLVTTAALLLAGPSFAQQPRVPRIGVLANTIPTADLVSGTTTHPGPRLLLQGLRDHGWIPGKNVEMVWRSAEGDYTRHPQQARELAAMCDVIVVYGPGIDAAVAATRSVPIVLATSGVGGEMKDQSGAVRIQSLLAREATSRA